MSLQFMKIDPTPLEGVLVIEPHCFRDERGFFLESFQNERYKKAGITENFVQDNHSHSNKRGILRGLHFQVKRPQAQIITVFRGCIYEAVVDLRPKSQSFGRWFGVELNDQGPRQIYLAAGFAHGFCVLSESADVHYKVSRAYDHDDEGGLLWNDLDIGVQWPIDAPYLLARDSAFPRLRDLRPDQLPHDPPIEIEAISRKSHNESN